MVNKINSIASIFRVLESEGGIVNLLRHRDTSSWVSIKNAVYSKSFIGKAGQERKDKLYAVFKHCVILAISILNLFRTAVHFKPRALFAGAGSGLQIINGVVVDSYAPDFLSKKIGVLDDHGYFLSAREINDLWTFKKILWDRRIVVYSYLVGIWRVLFSLFVFPLLRPSTNIQHAADLISKKLSCCDVELSSKEIVRLHYRFVSGYWFFKIIFAVLKVRTLYVVSAYSNSEQCAAARSRRALVYEIQHGVIGPVHRGYNYCVKSNILPTPDKVLVYDDFWKSELIAAGYFSEKDVLVSRRIKYLIAENETPLNISPYFIFTGQGLFREEVAKFLFDILSADFENSIVYVPHPTETQEYVEELIKPLVSFKNFVLGKGLGVSTERLIKDSVGHISIYSSCHFDAVTLLGKTYVLDIMQGNIMDYYVKNSPSNFLAIKNSNDFLRLIVRE